MGLGRENGNMVAPRWLFPPLRPYGGGIGYKDSTESLCKAKQSKSSPADGTMTNFIQRPGEGCGNTTNHASGNTERAVAKGRVNHI